MKACALVVALAGCNQVFGLDETVPAQDRGTVTGVYRLRWAENDDSGAPLVRDGVYDAEELSAEVELDDGTRRDVTFGSDGTFSFPTAEPGQPYSLTFRTTYSRKTYQHSATNLVLVDRIGARRDRELVPPNTELVYQVANRPLATLTSREEIVTTGIWTRKAVTDLATIRFDWASTTAQSEPLGLLDGGRFDDAYYVYFDRNTSYTRIGSSARARGTLVGGGTTTLSATAAALAPTLCTQIAVPSRQERDRLYALFPDGSSALALWIIHATPSQELAYAARLPLAYPNATVDEADVAGTIDYGSPFPGGTRALELGVIVYRPNTSYASVSMTTPVQDCPATTTIETGVVAVPVAISVAGSELVMMDQFVMIDRGAPVPVTWQASATGNADEAVVTLFELVDGIGVVRQTVFTAGGEVQLDPSDLETGRTYVVTVQLRLGTPGVATGNYDSAAGDIAVGALQSAPFRIAN